MAIKFEVLPVFLSARNWFRCILTRFSAIKSSHAAAYKFLYINNININKVYKYANLRADIFQMDLDIYIMYLN